MRILSRRISVSIWLPVMIFGTFGLFLLFSSLYQRVQMEAALEASAMEDVQELLYSTAGDVENYLRLDMQPLVERSIADIGTVANVQALALLDEHGRILQGTRLEWRGQLAAGRLQRFEPARFQAATTGQVPDTRLAGDGSAILAYYPVQLGAQADQIRESRVGALWLEYDLATAKALVWQRLVHHNLAIWGLSLLLLTLLHLALRRLLTLPLRALTHAVQRFAAGDLSARAEVGGTLEMQELGRAWNAMGDALAASMRHLEASRENLAVTLHSIGDAVIATDPAGRITLMNAVAERLTGWTRREASGHPLGEVFRIVDSVSRQPVSDPVQRVLESGEIVTLSNHTLLLARDGREFQIADSAAPIRDGTGQLSGVVLVFRDVTEEYALRKAGAREKAMLRGLIDSLPDLIFFKDRDGVYLGCNKAFEAFVGRPESAQVGKTDYDFFDAETAEFFRLKDREMMREGIPRANEEWVVYPDGRRALLETIKAPLHAPDGEILGLAGISRDITERRRAEHRLYESETQLRTIIEAEPECVKLLAQDGRLLQMNRAGLDMIEADGPEQVLGKPLLELVLPEYRRAFGDLTARVFSGQSGALEFEIIGLKGGHHWLDTHAVPLTDAEGKVTALLAVTRDITARKRAEQELRIAATAFETQEGIAVTDAHNRLIKVNQAFARLFGYTPEEMLGETPSVLKSGQHDRAFYDAMWDSLARERYWQGEVWDKRKDGTVFPVWLTITALVGEDGGVTNYIGTYADITQYKQAEEQIRRLAYFDALTGLPNRQQLYERVQQGIAASGRSQSHGALLFIDLDNFKTLNDTRGHDIGDRLLVEIGRRLQSVVRGEDVVGRLGGDEFVVLMTNLDEQVERAVGQAETVAEKVLHAIMQPFTFGGVEHFGSASIGITLFQGRGESVEDLFKHADAAMYQAKQAGRSAIRFFDPAMQVALETRMALEADMRAALALEQFSLYFQPQVDDAGEIHAAEVLLRWRHPERGMVAPNEFIPLAEECGLIVPIGLWVLKTACACLALLDAHPGTRGLSLSVNVSARQFRQENFVAQVREVLQQSGAPASRLKLELTESVVLHDVEDAVTKMQALRELGVTFAMDDFGTGQSSLSYLKKLPLDQLKIDQSFVHDIAIDQDDAMIVQTIIAMARNLGLEVIAEGVETQAQVDFLRERGCFHFQGYLFGRPLPMDAFLENFGVSARLG